MKNWQDYATNADTNQSKLSPEKLQHHVTLPTPKKNKISPWFIFNLALTILCGVAIIYGIISAACDYYTYTHNDVNYPDEYLNPLYLFINNVTISLLFPGIIIISLFNICINGTPAYISYANMPYAMILSIFVSIPLGIALIVNAILAFTSYNKQRYKTSSRRALLNFILATIPVIFVSFFVITRLGI